MTAGDATTRRVGFVLEQTLGHATHAANLRAAVAEDPRIDATFEAIEFAVSGWPARVPGYGNWTVRAGVRARRAIRRMRREGPLDALFIHTQVPAVLSPDHVRRIPTVVSLDATPLQYDELGQHYGHATGHPRVERLKWRANRTCLDRARTVVTWSRWARSGVVDGYDIPAEKVEVIPPGVDVDRWTVERHTPTGGPTRVLFVGGDFERKGGLDLQAAVRALRDDGVDVELDIVTRADIAPSPWMRVHHGLGPNDAGLIDLYQRADVFCLPTLGDALGIVLAEAGAVGLPLVATDVGGVPELARDGETGLVVPVADQVALTAALRRLADDAELRGRLGDGARRLVTAEYNAVTNSRRLIDLLTAVAGGER